MILISFSLLALLLLAAAASDGLRYVIPNWISVAVVFLFGLTAAFWHIDPSQLQARVLVAVGTLMVGFGLFSLGFMGGGDVKLWSAIALWLGPHLIWPHLILVGLLGGLLGIVLLVARSIRPRDSAASAVGKTHVPYGIAITGAALVLFPQIIESMAGRI
jgi:prepilin peptidase CpaA